MVEFVGYGNQETFLLTELQKSAGEEGRQTQGKDFYKYGQAIYKSVKISFVVRGRGGTQIYWVDWILFDFKHKIICLS